MLARIVEKQGLEVGAASREDHLVGLDGVAVTCESNVNERLALKKLVEYIGEITLVVVPTQTELLRGSHAVLHDAYSCFVVCRLSSHSHGLPWTPHRL